MMPARVEVRFGAPLDPVAFIDSGNEDGTAREFTRQMLKAIARLADKPYFEPTIAGRNWKPTKEELDAAMDAKERRDAAEKLAGPNGHGSTSQEPGARSQGLGVGE